METVPEERRIHGGLRCRLVRTKSSRRTREMVGEQGLCPGLRRCDEGTGEEHRAQACRNVPAPGSGLVGELPCADAGPDTGSEEDPWFCTGECRHSRLTRRGSGELPEIQAVLRVHVLCDAEDLIESSENHLISR